MTHETVTCSPEPLENWPELATDQNSIDPTGRGFR